MNQAQFIPKKIVASGSYLISNGANKILESYLGTCVGVTLCDRNADIGGMIHFLLPEPLNTGSASSPFHYASTGLPLFIQTLYESGAKKGELEACVAGGALVGPLTNLDFALDIGGRTVEIVESILLEENIPILKAETCGFFTCRLSMSRPNRRPSRNGTLCRVCRFWRWPWES